MFVVDDLGGTVVVSADSPDSEVGMWSVKLVELVLFFTSGSKRKSKRPSELLFFLPLSQ